MTRRPLDLLDKWLVSQYWAQQKPALTRANLVVLLRLLDRQNTKTGRCDPSVIGLTEETGLSERSVRGAFKELENRGALRRYRVSRRARNQFVIFSVEEVVQNKNLMELRSRAGQRTGLQPVAETYAIHCRQNLKRAAPKTINETKKKKDEAEKNIVKASGAQTSAKREQCSEIGLGEFESRVVKVFDREGYGYVGLMDLAAEDIEFAHAKMTSGAMSFSQALDYLLEAYRSLQDRSGPKL